MPRSLIAALALILSVTARAPAQGTDSNESGSTDPVPEFIAYPDEPSVTYHTVTLDGQPVHYQATAGTILHVSSDSKREPRARMFYVAYRRTMLSPEAIEAELAELREKAKDDETIEAVIADERLFPPATERPVTFSFNGGPGSSSVWLHLGVFGPQRVGYADELGHPGPPPYRVVANEHSLLGESDFVFIDPISTGFSRPEGETSEKVFHGLEPDVASVAAFIKRYITRTERWSSPLYVAGESYGTTRAAALAEHLHNSHGISASGVILISTVLDFGTIRFNAGHDLPYISFLPTYAAAAQHHGRLAPELQNLPPQALYEQARSFAIGEYASALMQGQALPAEQARRTAERMSELTGLSVDFIERSNLRVSQPRFCKELLRDRGLTVGRFDARFTGQDIDDAGESYEYDPSYAAIRANYTASFNAYVREHLGFESDLSYEILTNVWPWDFGEAGNGRFVNVAERLRQVIHQQPHLRVFNAAGYHDLATPPLGADYTLDHMLLDETLRGNVRREYYLGGHMMYLIEDSLAELSDDLVAFYRDDGR